MSRSTWDLVESASALIAALNGCETDEEALALLDEQLALEGEIADKLARIHAVQRRAEAEATHLRDEERRLAERRRRQERVAERVKGLAYDLLTAHRELTGEGRVVTPTLTARLQRSAPRLVVPSSPAEWPDAYVVQVPQLDRDAVRDALKRGEDVPGCSLEQSEHVRWA